MATYRVTVSWQMVAEIEIEADSEAAAEQAAYDAETLPEELATYLDNSFEVVSVEPGKPA